MQGIDLHQVPKLPSSVIVDLADYATLAYYAGFTVEVTTVTPNTSNETPRPKVLKHVTYIALSKRTMPAVVSLCQKFKDELDVYSGGTIEHVLSVSGD